MSIHRFGEKADNRTADLIKNKPGKHSDGGGLYLQVASPGNASWVWRHKETWRSIGPASVYKIEQAREIARKLRLEAHEGRDPFQLLTAGRARPTGKTFATAMAEYLKAKSPHWAASNRARELRRYEYLFGQIPDFVALPIRAIDQDAKNKALATWDGQTKKRRDVGFYIEAIIKYAETGYLRVVAMGDVKHHEAMPYRDVPAFYARLADSVDARALRFAILCGGRTGEMIGQEYGGKITKAPALWGEVKDVDGKPTWVIPGRTDEEGADFRGMKAKKTHHVPLTPQMVALLGKRRADDVPLFEVSSLNALRDTLKATDGGNGFTVHGFRSSLEDWAAEATNFPRDLVKLCTAHDTRTKTDEAYLRSDLLEKRREVIQAWSDFCSASAT